MRVLALNPFHAGSHRAFLNDWIAHSKHEFQTCTLSGSHWKWRMRHAAVELANQVRQRKLEFDAIFATDMMNLAEFLALAPRAARDVPVVLYFHENQFAYPSRGDGPSKDRDLHFAITNYVSVLAADAIWFNSDFNRESFCSALVSFLKKMPNQSTSEAERVERSIHDRSRIMPPGISEGSSCFAQAGPLRIAWVARWEHDKNPEQFFDAMRELKRQHIPFELIVLGESYRHSPECFDIAEQEFAGETLHWGWADSRAEYQRLLSTADVVVSTSDHEFFGIAIVEAMAAGCVPVLPDRLAYPEVVNGEALFLFDGTTSALIERLKKWHHHKLNHSQRFAQAQQRAIAVSAQYQWTRRADEMDRELETIRDSFDHS